MHIGIFLRSLVLFVAAALIIYGVSPHQYGLELLLKLVAFAIGASLLMPFLYPHLRGVRKGDFVLVSESSGLATTAIAINSGRIGKRIRVRFRDRSEELVEITGYAGMLTPAKAKVVEKEIQVI